jgi:hypothetical protein
MGNHPASLLSLLAACCSTDTRECILDRRNPRPFRPGDSEATGSQTEPTPRTCQTLSIVLALQPLPRGTGNREHCRSMEQEGNEVTNVWGWLEVGDIKARSREKPRITQRGNSSRSSTGLLATSQRLKKENNYIESKEGKQIRMGTQRKSAESQLVVNQS